MAKSVGWMRRGEVYLKVSSVDGKRFRGGKQPEKGWQVVFGELGSKGAGGKLFLRSRRVRRGILPLSRIESLGCALKNRTKS